MIEPGDRIFPGGEHRGAMNPAAGVSAAPAIVET